MLILIFSKCYLSDCIPKFQIFYQSHHRQTSLNVPHPSMVL
uniref:Uncharacterized protein n=1 Tax=Arundo donax TaxID=35708 RepID=A0A0A9C2X6_ARUDO